MKRTLKPLLIFCIITTGVFCRINPYRQGQEIYAFHCENCHMEDGTGLAGLIPSLHGSAFIRENPDQLVCLIRRGIPVNPETRQSMPANKKLTEAEMTNLLNYLRSAFSTEKEAFRSTEIRLWSDSCQ